MKNSIHALSSNTIHILLGVIQLKTGQTERLSEIVYFYYVVITNIKLFILVMGSNM